MRLGSSSGLIDLAELLMPYTPFQTTGAASPRRFRPGNRVQFIDPPAQAQFISAGITGRVTARVGYRAFEIVCDGQPITVVDLPENLNKVSDPTHTMPYTPTIKLVSRRKVTC